MNGRQAAKAAAKMIEELEYSKANQARDIVDYNACIQDMIDGKSPCTWCEEEEECQLEAKGGKGCHEWWLKYRKAGEQDAQRLEEGQDQSVQHLAEQ